MYIENNREKHAYHTKKHYNPDRPIHRYCHVTPKSRDFQTRVEKLLKSMKTAISIYLTIFEVQNEKFK